MIFADNDSPDSPKKIGIKSFPLKGNGTVNELLSVDTWVSDITALHSSMQTGKSFKCLCIAPSKQSLIGWGEYFNPLLRNVVKWSDTL